MALAPKQHGERARQKRDYRAIDRQRGTAQQRGYDKVWHKARKEALHRDDYLCQPCLRKNILTPTNLVDHIIPVNVRPDLRLEVTNMQACCPACNTAKSYEDAKQYGI